MIDRKKLFFTLIIFVGLFSLVIAKAFFIQVINRNRLIAYAQSQFERKEKKYPPRGEIVDRNGAPLAINIPTYNIFTIPKHNHNKQIYKDLAHIIPELSHAKILAKIKGRKNYTVLVKKIKLDSEQLDKIKKLEGIYWEKEYTRLYPNHELFSQTLGFVGGENKGLNGLELKYDKELRGEPRIVKFYRDAKGRPIKYENSDDELIAHKARTLQLTIDRDLQSYVEKVLKESVEEHAAKRAGAGVIDVETGEILAVANYPTFDSNRPNDFSGQAKRLSFVTDPFEPGSIFKTLVIASALEERVATPRTKYYCEKGKFKIGKHTISEAEVHEKFEWLTVEDILRFSSNIGTTKIAFDLNYPRLKRNLRAFGIGEKTGVEISGESKGIVNNKEDISKISLSNISFGHGIAVTAMQMLQAYATIANNGKQVTPTIIKNQERVLAEKKVMEESTAQALEKMLVKAVHEGTGTNAIIPHFQIAGKTGTAQRVSEKGGYSGYIASFVGYPTNLKNRFVVLTYVDDPQKGIYYGNAVAAPMFKKITQYILYKNKDFASLASEEDKTILVKEKNEAIDKVKITYSAPEIKEKLIPNFIGLDKTAASKLALENQIHVIHSGFGVVAEQIVITNENELEKKITLKLKYQPPQYE